MTTTDAHRVFTGMQEDGNPAADSKALLAGVPKTGGQLAEMLQQT